MSRRRRRARRTAGVRGWCIPLLVAGTVLQGRAAVADGLTSSPTMASVQRAGHPTRIYTGMWTSHLLKPGAGIDANGLLAVSVKGYFAGTFINSYGQRAVSGGIQRSFTRPRRTGMAVSAGYRLGFITGYDDRLLGIGGKVPVLPFAQLVGNLDYHRVGVEVGYTGVVATVAANWRF